MVYVAVMARPQGHTLSPEAFDDVLRLTGNTVTLVATRSGVPRATISSLLGGHHKASVPTTHKLAAALGVRPATLFPTLRAEAEAAA